MEIKSDEWNWNIVDIISNQTDMFLPRLYDVAHYNLSMIAPLLHSADTDSVFV